jgi:hypothetical protein
MPKNATDHMIVPCLILQETAKLFPSGCILYISTISCMSDHFFASSSALGVVICSSLNLECSPKHSNIECLVFSSVLLEGNGNFKRWDLRGGFSSFGVGAFPWKKLWDADLFLSLCFSLCHLAVNGFAVYCHCDVLPCHRHRSNEANQS